MNIVVAFKVVPDNQDISVAPDGSLDYSKARPVVSEYDLNALEAAALLAATQEDSKTVAISVSAENARDSKLCKNVLARGMDELFMVADDAVKDIDTHMTALALAALVAKLDAWDLIVCGDGSADNFVQQVDVQLAYELGVPVINGVVAMEATDGGLVCTRVLEGMEETVRIQLPAVISVAPDIALPRICGMKDILAAGKKPQHIMSADDVAFDANPSVELIDIKAPEQMDRKLEVLDFADEGSLDTFVQAIREATR